jgi:hypothetical protein
MTDKRENSATTSAVGTSSMHNVWVMALVFLTLVTVGIGVFICISFQRGEAGAPGKSIVAAGDYEAGTTYLEGTVVRFSSASWIVKAGKTATTAPIEGPDWQLLARDGEGSSSARTRGSITMDAYVPSLVAAGQQTLDFGFNASFASPIVVASSASKIITQLTGVTSSGANVICSTEMAVPNLTMMWNSNQITNTAFSHRFINVGSTSGPIIVPALFWSSGQALHCRVAKDIAGNEWNDIIDVQTTINDVLSVSLGQDPATLELVLLWVSNDEGDNGFFFKSLVDGQLSATVTRITPSTHPKLSGHMDLSVTDTNIAIVFEGVDVSIVLFSWDRTSTAGNEARWTAQQFRPQKIRFVVSSSNAPVVYVSAGVYDGTSMSYLPQLFQFTLDPSNASELMITTHSAMQPSSNITFQWVAVAGSVITIGEADATRFNIVRNNDGSFGYMAMSVPPAYRDMLTASDRYSVLEMYDIGGWEGLIPSLLTSSLHPATGMTMLNHYSLIPRRSVIDWAVL